MSIVVHLHSLSPPIYGWRYVSLKGIGSTGWIGKTPPVHSREPYETWNGCRIDFLATQIKNPLKAGRNTKGKSDGGSRKVPKVEGFRRLQHNYHW